MDSRLKKFFDARVETEKRKNVEIERQRAELRKKLEEIEKYCGPYKRYLWSSTIIGIIKGTDVRDKR